MNRFALLTLYRSLTRHPLYAGLNIGGLAIGIAVFLVLGLYVRFETSFEKWLPHHDQIYLVQTRWTMPDSPINGIWPNTMGGLYEQLKEDFPDTLGTRIYGDTATVIRNGIGTQENFVYVDRDFFKVFDLPIVKGDAAGALANPSNLFIDQKLAAKYFPGVDPVGRTLTLSIDGMAKPYRIAAVFEDLPKATDLSFDMFAPIPAKPDKSMSDYWYHWGSTSLFTYLRFPTAAAAAAYQQRLPSFIDRRGRKDLGPNASRSIDLSLRPIVDEHWQTPGRKLTVATLGIVGVLTLLIAIVNYVNLATARAGLRAREVAMRKVLGANRRALIRQFIGEAVATAAIAALVGLALAELGLPLVNAAGGLSLTMPYAVVIPALALIVLIVGVLAGLYPAVLLSRFQPAAVLASARSPGGGRSGARVREALVIAQFGLAIAFIIGTMVLVAQTSHVRRTDLGFRREGLAIVTSLPNNALTDGQRASLLAAFGAVPTVRSVTISDTAPGNDDTNNNNNLPLPGVPGDGPSLKDVQIGANFFRTYGARLLAGRFFDAHHGLDDATGLKWKDPRNIIINRHAVSTLNFKSPQDAIGKTVGRAASPRTIVGVVDDLRFHSPRKPIPPTYYEYHPRQEDYPLATVRFEGDPRATIDALRAVWRRIAPEVEFQAKTAEQNLAFYYKPEDHAAHLFTIGAVLAVLIGCVGLWGLASFNTARRVKEIGIRKTLGASSADVVRLLVGQFLRPVLIANIIAWPLAYIAMRKWLAGFDDRIALSPLFFIAATLLALAIAVLTVIAQSLRAARAEPAWALRHE